MTARVSVRVFSAPVAGRWRVDGHARARRAAQLFHGVGQRHLLHVLAVDFHDAVARQNPRAKSRRIVHRRDHRDVAVLHLDDNAQPAKLPLGIVLQFLVIVRVKKFAVRVERRDHRP